MNIKNPCKKVELRARFVVVTTKLVPDSPYRHLVIADTFRGPAGLRYRQV